MIFLLLGMLIVTLVNPYSLNQGEKIFCINYVILLNASVLNSIDLRSNNMGHKLQRGFHMQNIDNQMSNSFRDF